ncbi:MAG: hypothetical protein J6I84_04345 [Bacilli bacterium]|nr:hypothetical protein [Bacilli bacterium]
MKVKYRIRGSGNQFSLHLATMNEDIQITIGYIHWNPGWPKKKTRLCPGLFLVVPVFITEWSYSGIIEEGYIEDPISFLDKCPTQGSVFDFKRYASL